MFIELEFEARTSFPSGRRV